MDTVQSTDPIHSGPSNKYQNILQNQRLILCLTAQRQDQDSPSKKGELTPGGESKITSQERHILTTDAKNQASTHCPYFEAHY